MYIAITILLSSIFYLFYYIFLRSPINLSNNSLVNNFLGSLDKTPHVAFISKYFYLYIMFFLLSILLTFYFIRNYIVIAIIVICLAVTPYLIIRYVKNKRIQLFEKQLPDAIDLMAGSLVAGNSLSGSFALIAKEYPPPLSEEIGMVVREQKLGLSIDESLQNFTKRMPYNSVILTVSVMRTSIETGGELSSALKNVARTLRNIEQAEGKIKALTAQGKMQAWVVGLMPVMLILVLSKMEPESMAQLWTTKEGYLALTALLIFEVLGVIFIRKIVNIDI